MMFADPHLVEAERVEMFDERKIALQRASVGFVPAR